MASLPPSSFLYHYLLGRLLALFTSPPVCNSWAADDFRPPRREDDPAVEASKNSAARFESGSEGGETSQGHGHSHECILQLDTGLSLSEYPCFILDSGAACHVTGDRSLFSSSSFRTVTAPTGSAAAYYMARDGRRLDVAGVGTISCNKIHLPDVLCVPSLNPGVICVSVQQLAKRDYVVMFGGGLCYVREQSSGELVGKGRLYEKDGLYHLESLSIPPDNTDAMNTPA